MIPILSMPEDDKTHPIPRPDWVHHRRPDHPEPGTVPEGLTPPIDVLPSLSRLEG